MHLKKYLKIIWRLFEISNTLLFKYIYFQFLNVKYKYFLKSI